MSDSPIGPVHTGARCDHDDCDVDVKADYVARSWAEAAGFHARDLVAAGWRIEGPNYFCPAHEVSAPRTSGHDQTREPSR